MCFYVDADHMIGDTVAEGMVTQDVNDDRSQVQGGGSLMGPASFVNSACSKHSNVRFGKNYQLVATATITAGSPIYGFYIMGHETFRCPFCLCKILGPR